MKKFILPTGGVLTSLCLKLKNHSTALIFTLLLTLPNIGFAQYLCQQEATFDVDMSTCPVTFTAINTPPGAVHKWNFGDGDSANGPTVSHTYPAGQHTWVVSQQVIIGQTSFFCLKEIETNCPQQCNELFTFTETECGEFDFTPSIPLEDIIAAEWDFGDGSGSTAFEPHHTFTTWIGTREVVLTLTFLLEDGTQMTQTCTELIWPSCVAPCEPSNFTYRVNDCTVDFTGFAQQPYVIDHSWDFGDNNTSTELTPSHTYASSGEYIVTRYVTYQFTPGGQTYNYECQRTITVECGECDCLPAGAEITSCFNIPPYFCDPCGSLDQSGYVCLAIDGVPISNLPDGCTIEWFQDGDPVFGGCPNFDPDGVPNYSTTFNVKVTNENCDVTFEDELTINLDCDSCGEDDGLFELQFCPDQPGISCEDCAAQGGNICVVDQMGDVLDDPNYVVSWSLTEYLTSCTSIIPGQTFYGASVFNLTTGCRTYVWTELPCVPMMRPSNGNGSIKGNVLAEQVRIYPNPANQYFNMYNATDEILTAKLTSIAGKVISTFNLPTRHETSYSTEDLPNGIYFLHIWDTVQQQFKTHKIAVIQ